MNVESDSLTGLFVIFHISPSMLSIVFCRVSLVYKLAIRMSSTKVTYEDAVQKLNLLQSNKSTIEQIRRDIKAGQRCTNIEDMEKYLKRTGVTLTMLDKLSVIHVAGTKGKGSTSAMCESVLRSHGFRTGFYSSPHLIAVRERIRLHGCILSKDKFAKHFHQVYDALYNTQEFEGDMPKYFAFLTVLAFNVFLKEAVDVAIVEVGIGGIVDYTNVLRKVPVVGITALGLDHTAILGNTLPAIAAAKAGIMKPGCEAFTVQQPPEAMEVLKSVAENVKCSLNIVPEFSMYKFENGYRLSIELEAYRTNASLAVQLAHAWMRIKRQNLQSNKKQESNAVTTSSKKNNESILIDTLLKDTIIGLRKCKWPGRYQVINLDYADFFLDGAHTKESMDVCAKWFKENNSDRAKVLIFSATGDRDAEVLLEPLKDIDYASVYFVIPKAIKEVDKKDDNYSIMEQKQLLLRCKSYELIWKKLNNRSQAYVSECVSDVLIEIKKNSPRASVLVTGSLHLVGATLSLIDPNLGEELLK